MLDLRYNIGLSNLCNHKVLDETWRSNSLWLTLGYQFKMYRDCSTHYQSDAFWMDDSDEYYCDIRMTRIA